MVKIENIDNLNYIGKNKKKTQIILSHTSRNLTNYLTALKTRHNGKYNKVPNFVIDRGGIIYQLLPDGGYSSILPDLNQNKNSIFISFENLGWLEKIPLTNNYVNWIGDIYNQEIIERKWRDYFFWQPYTNEQIESCYMLCEQLTNQFSIDKTFIGHNTKVNGITKFNGIVSKSNYSSEYTDLSPAFNFEEFTKKFENE